VEEGGEDVGARPVFDDLARVHDGHVVGHLGHDAEVVGDEQKGRARLLLHPAHEGEDARLWIVTSRAVVGSSAMSSAGRRQRAMAIMTRCFMPPESW
jgi:hypothetical protein